MQDRCPVCRIRLHRGEEGYQVGAYMFNIVAAELIFAAIFLGVLVYTWPTPPWDLLLYGGVILMVVVPFLVASLENQSTSTQSNVRWTAFFQRSYPVERCSSLHCGCQRFDSFQLERSSSVFFQNPTASPAA